MNYDSSSLSIRLCHAEIRAFLIISTGAGKRKRESKNPFYLRSRSETISDTLLKMPLCYDHVTRVTAEILSAAHLNQSSTFLVLIPWSYVSVADLNRPSQ